MVHSVTAGAWSKLLTAPSPPPSVACYAGRMTDVLIRPAHPFDAAFAVPLIQATIGAIGLALTGASASVEAERAMLRMIELAS